MEACRACGSSGQPTVPSAASAFQQLDCRECGSTSFFGSASDTHERYAQIYDQAGEDEQFSGLLARTRLELLSRMPYWAAPPPRLRTSDRVILKVVTACIPPHAPIVDWGCGSGRLVQTLGRRGYEAIGAEVSNDLITAMRRGGIPAAHIDEFRAGKIGKDYAAVVLAEVLEHVPDPLGMLTGLSHAFPRAIFVASVPSPHRQSVVEGRRELWDSPPNHLTRFTRSGLAQLFERSGLHCRIILPRPAGADSVPSWWMSISAVAGKQLSPLMQGPKARASEPESDDQQAGRRLSWHGIRTGAAVGLIWSHWAYIRLGQGFSLFRAWQAARRGLTASSIVAVGTRKTDAGEPSGVNTEPRLAAPL
jgi:SAM-dependent methyltransferase